MNDTKRYGRCSDVGCDVESCVYNENGCSCTAEHINVDGKRAHATCDTCCSTFKEKSGCANC